MIIRKRRHNLSKKYSNSPKLIAYKFSMFGITEHYIFLKSHRMYARMKKKIDFSILNKIIKK